MASSQVINRAARILRSGGVITYPTEGVYGIGCLPDDPAAVARVLEIKDRDASLGFVLIATAIEQLDGWVENSRDLRKLKTSSDKPVTWIVPATDAVPYWIRGDHSGLAVRMTTHPIARALCDAVDSALVSTSANLHGRPPARTLHVLRRNFGALVDYIVPGACGPASGPSEIRDLLTGKVLRSA